MGKRREEVRLPPPKEPVVVVTVRLPVALVQRIDKIAKRDIKTRSQVIWAAAYRYVEKEAA